MENGNEKPIIVIVAFIIMSFKKETNPSFCLTRLLVKYCERFVFYSPGNTASPNSNPIRKLRVILESSVYPDVKRPKVEWKKQDGST